MRIAIDIRVLGGNLFSGIPEYTFNIIDNLLKIDKENEYILFFNSAKRDISLQDFGWENYKNVKLIKYKIPNKILDIFSLFLKRPRIEDFLGEVDVYFLPHFSLIPSKAPRVLVFHDLSFVHFPEFFNLKRRLWHYWMRPKKQAKESKKIITPSFFTKNDLEKTFKIKKEKIEVAYHGIKDEFKFFAKEVSLLSQEELRKKPEVLKIKEKHNLPDKFLLYLGTIEPRKNIFTIAEAFCFLKENRAFKDYKLILVGSFGWLYKDILKKISKLSCKNDIIFLGPVQNKDKKYLYSLADVFVYPSFFEGFGFPPLEALACGTPVIVSERASLPEIVGEVALLTDPHKSQELAKAIESVILDRVFRDNLREEGLKYIEKFDWQKSAKEVLEIFKKVNEQRKSF